MTFDIEFEDVPRLCEDGYLLGTLLVNGVRHHANFIRVTYEDGVQVPAPQEGDGANAARFEDLCQLYEADGPFTTVTIDGDEYVCVIHPYSQ